MIGPEIGWRLAFLIGATLALVIFFMRLSLPESPRWLMTHGHDGEAHRVSRASKRTLPSCRRRATCQVPLRSRRSTPLWEVAQTLFKRHRQRTSWALRLMVSQAFFYNAIFFTYALILTDFYGVPSERVGWYLLPFAAGNFLGPVLIGRLFDTAGRKPMIAFTYIMSGLLLAGTGWLFQQDLITAESADRLLDGHVLLCVGRGELGLSHRQRNFPLEIRALAIAFFYAVGTGIGGIIGPTLFGALIDTGSRTSVFGGYLVGSLLMILGGLVAWRWGVAAERKPLEMVARPLTFIDID